MLLLLCISATTLGWSQVALVPLPKGDKLLLPLQIGISAQMIYAPKTTIIAHPRNMVFLVDRDGLPWLSNDGTHLINLLKRSLIVVDKKYQDAAYFDDGTLVLCTDRALGYLEEPTPEEKRKNRFLMRFHPRLTLPYKNMRIFAGENGAIYVVGKNPDDGKDELFLSVDDVGGKKYFLKLVAIKEGISAVAGDGETTYFASGTLIVKVARDHKKMERVIKLAADPIRELAYSSKAGLFYSNGKGVAYVGTKNPLIFLSGSDLSIRMRKDSLYVLFVKDQEVMKFGGVSGFSKLLGRK